MYWTSLPINFWFTLELDQVMCHKIVFDVIIYTFRTFVGDTVFCQTDEGYSTIARIDKMWTDRT